MASAPDDQRRLRASSPPEPFAQPASSPTWVIDLRPLPQPSDIGLDPNMAEHGLGGTPLDIVADALKRFQDGPDILRLNLALSFAPVLGPGWEALVDLQDGNYGGAFFNGGVAVADAFGVGVAAKGLKAAGKGIKAFKIPPMTDNAARKAYRAKGMVGEGEEVSHMIGFRGTDRKAPNWRNSFWYGTNDWVKVAPPAVAGRAADVVENVNRPRPGGSSAPRSSGNR